MNELNRLYEQNSYDGMIELFEIMRRQTDMLDEVIFDFLIDKREDEEYDQI